MQSTLDRVLKYVGAIPKVQAPNSEPTQFQREVDKLLRYRIGALPYKAGQEYLLEPIQCKIIKQGLYDKLRLRK